MFFNPIWKRRGSDRAGAHNDEPDWINPRLAEDDIKMQLWKRPHLQEGRDQREARDPGNRSKGFSRSCVSQKGGFRAKLVA